MASSIIEQLDQSRYKMVKWLTVGWAIWFGTFILEDMITNKIIILMIIVVGLTGWVFWMINLLRFMKFGKMVNEDTGLKNALNDELMQHNRNRSYVIGYWTTIIIIGILTIVSNVTDISAILVCEIVLYGGVLSALISSLIFNRS